MEPPTPRPEVQVAVTYRFGQVEVRPAERQLLVKGQPAAVGARAFDVLLALIDNRDRVVTKDELLQTCWPGLIVEENNLQVQVSTLRKVLGAQAVATIPGRGYRFTLVPEAADSAPSCPLPRNHNLPAPLNSFIGREKEIAEVRGLLEGSRLVTLTSTGGTGKTRLSLQVAAECLDKHPDGVWFVELAPLSDGRRVPQAVASALGATEDAGRPMMESLVKHVKEKRLLLVLDNCEHLVRAAADVAKQLLTSAPGVRILASSREPLHVSGEVTYSVPALPTAQAIRLFVDRANAANPAFHPAEAAEPIAEICQRLDGIPLAIELAAARVRALSVEKIASRLDDCFRLLTGGDQTTLPRQQTLRASIDWSHDLLSLPERVLLRRLAVFSGGWTLEAAEEVGAGGEIEQAGSVLEILTNLVEKSLVAADAPNERYHFLETVRQYALEHLEESGEADAVRQKHLEHYLALAEKARPELLGPSQARWLALLDRERANVLAAHQWCAFSEANRERGLKLVSHMVQYWIVRGIPGLARGIMEEALERSPARSRARCRTLFDAGQIAYFMGQYREARRELEESLSIARETRDGNLLAICLAPLGMACLGEGDLASARRYLEEALMQARDQQEPRRIAAVINSIAQLHRVEGNLDQAEPLFEHVLDLARELDDRESIAIAQLNLAMTSIQRGLFRQGVERLGEAAAIAHSTGSKPVGQSVLEVCAGLAAKAQKWTCAARFYGAAEAEAAHTGIRRDPADESFLAPCVAIARAAAGPDRFLAAEAEGRALPYPAALQEARAWLDTFA